MVSRGSLGLFDTPGVEGHSQMAAKPPLSVGVGLAVSDKYDAGQSEYLHRWDSDFILARRELSDNREVFCLLYYCVPSRILTRKATPMHDLLSQALKGHDADYIEVRIEEAEANRILYRGRELEDIGTTTSLGGNVRALVKGGWGFVSFNELDDLEDKVSLAVRQARLVGRETSTLAPIEPVVDVVEPSISKDPASFSIAHKKNLMGEYNEIMWGVPGIQTTNVGYSDGLKKVVFANSEGSYIEQQKVDVTMRLSATAKNGSQVQQAG